VVSPLPHEMLLMIGLEQCGGIPIITSIAGVLRVLLIALNAGWVCLGAGNYRCQARARFQ